MMAAGIIVMTTMGIMIMMAAGVLIIMAAGIILSIIAILSGDHNHDENDLCGWQDGLGRVEIKIAAR